ncbi:hypothetical protein Prudu_001298, partial [Prunus dulcis]
SLSGIIVNISKLHLYKLCAKRATDFQKVLAPPPSSNGHGTGGVGTAIESPTFSNRPQPWGRPELAGKSCFPTEVRPKLPKLPARNSPSFLHQIDRAPGARQNYKRDLRGIEVARTICHRNMRDPPPSHSNPPHHHVRGDSAEISAEV